MTRVENYELLLEKLKPKKSTDDCHTSDDFYDKAREQLLETIKQFLETFEQEAKKMTKTLHEVGISEMEFKAIEAGIFDVLILENIGFQKGDLIKFIVNPHKKTSYKAGDLYEITHVKTIKQPICKLRIRLGPVGSRNI